MKTLFVVSDVHSYYDEMISALEEQGFDKENKDHIFISCGDLLDRGPKANECLEYVNNLDRKILIRGNHEDLMEDAIYRGFFRSHDYHNCTHETVYQVTGIHPEGFDGQSAALEDMRHNESWLKYIKSCINFYETDKYIFVHGYIPITHDYENYSIKYNENWRDDFEDWRSARWLNGMAMWDGKIRVPDKTIICGHWHSSYGHAILHGNGVEFAETTAGIPSIHTPFYDDGIIAIDACTAYSGFVNCIKLEVEDE